jgi:hypothetical protein
MACTHAHSFFFLAVVGFELRASHLPGMCSTASTMPAVLCALVIFRDRLSLFAKAGLDGDPPICASCCSCDDRCVPPCPDYFLLRWSLMNFFSPRLALNHDPTSSHMHIGDM